MQNRLVTASLADFEWSQPRGGERRKGAISAEGGRKKKREKKRRTWISSRMREPLPAGDFFSPMRGEETSLLVGRMNEATLPWRHRPLLFFLPGVILSVCDEEVAHYETANLTAAAVPALLLPPPTTPLDEHLVAGLPPLEPYARLYYAIATPSATQRLLLGLLEAPPSWAPDALDAAVQLVELLRAAEDYASGMRVCIVIKIKLS
ncbi:hypothetical protein B296_00052385 [Ensete ventricosum]|uniref:Uncharacterized protein n=1 Tax=Ensete ventricosum TaxID=4639 RepID=A0A426YCM1_ENSVE|nr:hypothetical protein B296_00052385 [Ensete ventricosum]